MAQSFTALCAQGRAAQSRFSENLVSPSLPGWFCKMSGYFKNTVGLKITLQALLVLL